MLLQNIATTMFRSFFNNSGKPAVWLWISYADIRNVPYIWWTVAIL